MHTHTHTHAKTIEKLPSDKSSFWYNYIQAINKTLYSVHKSYVYAVR